MSHVNQMSTSLLTFSPGAQTNIVTSFFIHCNAASRMKGCVSLLALLKTINSCYEKGTGLCFGARMQMYACQLQCLNILSLVWACRNYSGQGWLSLSGAEVRRQRQEHRPDCLDLHCLLACFVTMQCMGRWGGGGKGLRLVHRVFVVETLWHQVAFECLMLNSTLSIVAQRETTEQRNHLAAVFWCATYKHPRISFHLFPFILQIPAMGVHIMIDYSYSLERA